ARGSRDHRGALQGVGGRRADRADRSRVLLPSTRGARPNREYPHSIHRGPLPRTLADLPLRQWPYQPGGRRLLHRVGGLDVAESLQPDRGREPGAGRGPPEKALGDPRHLPPRPASGLGARKRRSLYTAATDRRPGRPRGARHASDTDESDARASERVAGHLHRQHHAELRAAAQHALIRLRRLLERILLDHRAHARELGEAQRVLRIGRRAGVPARFGKAASRHAKVGTMSNRYAPLGEYGVIGDLHTVALVSMDGSIDFLCLPSFDSPSVFAALLDAERGGRFQIAPKLERATRRQLYLPDTNVLLTRFLHADGVAEISDFMPVEDVGQAHNLVRRAKTVRGELTFQMRCDPRFDYARSPHTAELKGEREVIFVGRAEARELVLRLRSSVPMRLEDGAAVA